MDSSGYIEGLWDEAEILFMASSVGQQRRKGDRDRDGAKKIKIAHLRSEAGTHSISQSVRFRSFVPSGPPRSNS